MSSGHYTVISGIYAIRHVDSGKIYIGSAVNFFNRWRGHRFHLNRGTHSNRRLQGAWNKYGSDAFVFEILEVIEDLTKLVEVEQDYLDAFDAATRGVGYNLSPTAGSCIGVRHSAERRARLSEIKKNQSAETRAKIGAANRRRIFTPETRARMSASQKARSPESFAASLAAFRTPEARAKSGMAHRGRKHSLEHRAKIGKAQRGRKRSPETCAKMSASIKAACQRPEVKARKSAGMMGYKHSPETRIKLSESAKNRPPMSAETRAKISAAGKGRKHSPETRAKLSVSIKAAKKDREYIPVPPKPCSVCGQLYKPLRKGRCKRCAAYFYAHGCDQKSTSD